MVLIAVVTVTSSTRSGGCRAEKIRGSPVFKVESEKSIFEDD